MYLSGALAAGYLMFFLPKAWAFLPSVPLVSRTSRSSDGASVSLTRRQTASSTLHMEIDQNIIYGAGVAVAGLAFGAGLVAFTEKQGERTAERGGISDETKMKMSAMFMEDDVVETTDVDDVRTRMRAALRADQTEEELEAMTAKAKAKAMEEADDGW